MTLSPTLVLRQSTQLVMTPQLQQAIKLLQMSNQELSTFVESEIEENPLLEREDPEGGRDHENEVPATEGHTGDEHTGDEHTGDEHMSSETLGEFDDTPPDTAELSATDHLPDTAEAPLDTDYANDLTNDDRNTHNDAAGGDERAPEQFANWGSGGGEGEGPSLEDRLTGEESLRDHLNFQINVELDDVAERLIATALTDGLDDAGYLTVPVSDVAERLGIDTAKVEAVLARCQTFDPSGVYARDLAECLQLQLMDRDRFDPAMEKLVQNLNLLAKRDVVQLKRLCKVDDEDLADMVSEIRALNPKPGLAFETNVTQTVVPDILLRAGADGVWQVELNADTLPRVLVNQTYYAEVRSVTRAKADRDYLADRMASANWLVRALHQRATTILKVATEIVRTQEDFLEKGVQHLKPLTLREVADAIGMHESTVSRVTTSKFMTTPRGLFELKYFFTTAIASNAGGDSHSAESVRHRIRELTEHETSRTVLSDDKIVTILSDEGIDIARRTVAKYRDALRIPSSSQRRREKAISL
jgi:RNA polymerase sigma-54 factor